MSDRVYVILKVVEGKSAQVVRALRSKQGVIMADVLEGPGDVMMVAEASERRRLAELTVQAIISVEAMTGEVRLLPIERDSPESSPGPGDEKYKGQVNIFKEKFVEEILDYGQNTETECREVLC